MPDKVRARVLREFAAVLSAGGAYDDLEIGPVPSEEEWYVEHIACVDETNAITKRGYAVKSGGYLYWIEEEAVTTAGLRDGRKVRLVLSAGESLIVRLTGCTANDVIKAWAVGSYAEVGE